MNKRAKLEARSGGPGSSQDSGFTLVEMMVAVFIMGIFMAMVTAAMIHLVNPTLQTEAISATSSQLDLAFLDMDQEVRYASAIWPPTPESGNYYVVFESTFNGTNNANCTELLYSPSKGELEQRTWAQASPGATGPSFEVIATNLAGTTDPFSFPATAYEKQQLTVSLSAASGAGNATAQSTSSVTFTALDSTTSSPPSTTACLPAWI